MRRRVFISILACMAILLLLSVAIAYSVKLSDVKARLKELGYDPGVIDNTWNDTVKTAIEKYQTDHKLVITSEWDQRTLQSLGLLPVYGKDLIDAAGRGDISSVKSLLDMGADVNAKNKYGETALIAASEKGHAEIVKALLDKGAEVNAKREKVWTALMLASENGHTEIVKALLDKGAEVNAKRMDGSTALMLASENGHTEIVKALLDKGADVNAKNKSGLTALSVAYENDHYKAVETLLAKGADASAVSAAYKEKQSRIAKLNSYIVGQTTLESFWEDKLDARNPFYGMLGIIGGKRTDDSLTLIIGIYKPGNLPTTVKISQVKGGRTAFMNWTYPDDPNPEQIRELADLYQSTFDLLRSSNFIWDQEFGQKIGELVFKPDISGWLLESISLKE